MFYDREAWKLAVNRYILRMRYTAISALIGTIIFCVTNIYAYANQMDASLICHYLWRIFFSIQSILHNYLFNNCNLYVEENNIYIISKSFLFYSGHGVLFQFLNYVHRFWIANYFANLKPV